MELAGRRALVTGANRGLGEQFVEALLARGVDRVYAGARNTEALLPLTARHGDRVVPVRLDVTVPSEVQADPARNDQIDAAYRSKYRNYGGTYVEPMVSSAARAATLRLVPA